MDLLCLIWVTCLFFAPTNTYFSTGFSYFSFVLYYLCFICIVFIAMVSFWVHVQKNPQIYLLDLLN
jgi:hypothetical protein